MFEFLNPYLGWSSLVFYIMIVVFGDMQKMRKWAYASIINDIFYGLSMGINGLAKVVINVAVGGINTDRYLKDFGKPNVELRTFLTCVTVIAVTGITGYGMYSLYSDFSIAGLLLWVDAAIVIGSLTVKDIKKYQAMMLLACFPAIAGYWMIGEFPMVIIKVLVGAITFHKLFIQSREI